MWLKWLEKEADIVSRVFAFDVSKAFHSINHSVLFSKFKQLAINPYIVSWVIVTFLLHDRQRRV